MIRTRSGRQAQNAGRVVPIHDGSLGAGLDYQQVAVHPGGTGLGLDIGMLDIGRLEHTGNQMLRLGERVIGLSADHATLDKRVPLPVLMNERRVLMSASGKVQEMLERRPGNGKTAEIQPLDRISVADDEGDGLAPIANDLVRQGRLVGKRWDDAELVFSDDIGGGDNGPDPRVVLLPAGDVAQLECCVVVGGADRANEVGAIRAKVGAEDLRSVDLRLSVEADDRPADRTAGQGSGRGGCPVVHRHHG